MFSKESTIKVMKEFIEKQQKIRRSVVKLLLLPLQVLSCLPSTKNESKDNSQIWNIPLNARNRVLKAFLFGLPSCLCFQFQPGFPKQLVRSVQNPIRTVYPCLALENCRLCCGTFCVVGLILYGPYRNLYGPYRKVSAPEFRPFPAK